MSEIQFPDAFMKQVSQLKSNPVNVKQHPEEQIHDLMELIKMVGFKDPIVIDKTDTIWAGHGRLIAAKKLGMKEVKCIYMENLTETEKKVFLLMDNRINESPWEFSNFKTIFDEISPALSDTFVTNFDDLIEFSSKPNPEDWANAFKNEDDVLPDSIQMTFNIPVGKVVRFKEYLKKWDEKNKDNALMKMYQFCKKNMKS